MLTRDHTVLPATHTFIHKWNEPCLVLLPSRTASPHFGWCLFPVPLRVGGWVGLGGLAKYWGGLSPEDGHRSQYQSTNWARRRVISLIRPTMLPLRYFTALWRLCFMCEIILYVYCNTFIYSAYLVKPFCMHYVVHNLDTGTVYAVSDFQVCW